MTARPKWCTEENKERDLMLDISKFCSMYFKGCRVIAYKHAALLLNYGLPKSIPSDTFPLATDSRIAPLPFSHALTEQREKWTIQERDIYTSIYHRWIDWWTLWQLCVKDNSLWPPGIFPGPCSSLQHLEFRWKSAYFSGYSPGYPVKTHVQFHLCESATRYACLQNKRQTQALPPLLPWCL